ncbi:TPA: hypothetical protein ROX98_002239 [Bacillus pseudomycoides]|nr:hypothetical protein [Bacillus pseudomycoides]
MNEENNVKAFEVDYEVGTENLNGTPKNSAKIGDVLRKPEIGWKRYDGNVSKIKYCKIVDYPSSVEPRIFYKGSTRTCQECAFTFYGRKLRIISAIFSTSSAKSRIVIDGQRVEYFSQNTTELNDPKGMVAQRLAYELELPLGVHKIQIKNLDDSHVNGTEVDAIDIDGELLDMEDIVCNASNDGDRAILSISMVNGYIKDYDITKEELYKFLHWYEERANGKGISTYIFDKVINPYQKVNEYIVNNKIASFEVREYSLK